MDKLFGIHTKNWNDESFDVWLLLNKRWDSKRPGRLDHTRDMLKEYYWGL